MPEWAELWIKTGQRGLLIANYKRLIKKDSDRAITSVADAVHVPAQLAPPGSPQAKQWCDLHVQLLLGQSCYRQKKVLRLCKQGCFGSVQLCDPVDCGLPGFSVSRQEYWSILANIGCHTLLEHYITCCPSRQLPLSTWCCQYPCNPGSCTTSTPGPHRGKPKPSRAASGANPSG